MALLRPALALDTDTGQLRRRPRPSSRLAEKTKGGETPCSAARDPTLTGAPSSPSKHSSLHNHPLDDTRQGRHRKNSRAVWITLRYRAIYVVDGETNVWYWIGSHEDYNIFTGRK